MFCWLWKIVFSCRRTTRQEYLLKITGLNNSREQTHLFLLPPAFQHSPFQELNPFLQLPVFMPIHHPPPDLQNILTAEGRRRARVILQNRDREGGQHLLLQQLCVLHRQSGLQQGREGVAQGQPALQRTY